MLLQEFDKSPRAVINPTDLMPPVPGMPKVLVSCFAGVTFERMVALLNAQLIAASQTAKMTYPIYRAEAEDVPIALQMAGVGACVRGQLGGVLCHGVETAVLFGNCGVLDRDIADCSIILLTSALRDEGTSFHYVPPSEEIEVNLRYRDLFLSVLAEHGVPCTMGKTWTADAFYRETPEKVRRRREQGCVCVEMEASAAAALARFRGKEAFIFFYAGDSLDGDGWDARSLSGHARIDEKDRAAYLALKTARRIALEKQKREV